MEEKKNLWSSYDEAAKKELHEINEKYKACLDAGKTERECVKLAVEMAKEAGYQDIKDVLKEGKSLKAGDKVYAVCMEKMLAMFRMGEEPLSNGMNILGAHIDSPRIDVKQNPNTGKCFFVYGCETGAVSERFLKRDITKPVISQVCSPETGDMFYMLHQQGDGGAPTLATL